MTVADVAIVGGGPAATWAALKAAEAAGSPGGPQDTDDEQNLETASDEELFALLDELE